MTYERFEDTPAWQAAARLGVDVHILVDDRAFARCPDVRDQLQRASLSVSNNIAEGFERGSTAEVIAFLYIARGSAGEVRSALRVASELPWLAQLRERMAALIRKAEEISRQLRGWADSLQNSDIRGQKHLNEETREAYRSVRRVEAFRDKLEEIKQRGRLQPPAEREQ